MDGEDFYSKRLRCANYEICHPEDIDGQYLPNWWHIWDKKDSSKPLCTNCHMNYGEWTEHTGIKHVGKGALVFRDNIECPICLELTRCVSQPRCDHYACLKCFRRCYYPVSLPQPPCPNPELREEFDNNPDDPRWEGTAMKEWDDEINRLLDIEEEQYERDKYLRACPLCRQT